MRGSVAPLGDERYLTQKRYDARLIEAYMGTMRSRRMMSTNKLESGEKRQQQKNLQRCSCFCANNRKDQRQTWG